MKDVNMYKYFITILIIFITFSCGDETNQIPNVPVNFSIQASELGGVGSAIYTQDIYGVRGIIIYHKNNNEYLAYERTCTFRPTNDCSVVKLNDELNPSFMLDSCCKSSFLLDDGTPFSGPALLPLKQYSTSYDGTYIYITN
jgi:nitrite reductase/ring-hydroxylating ferredoxin subunit